MTIHRKPYRRQFGASAIRKIRCCHAIFRWAYPQHKKALGQFGCSEFRSIGCSHTIFSVALSNFSVASWTIWLFRKSINHAQPFNCSVALSNFPVARIPNSHSDSATTDGQFGGGAHPRQFKVEKEAVPKRRSNKFGPKARGWTKRCCSIL